jgi:TRAP-type C4-dicarboxylate transport system substrate-binding protein
VAAESPELNVSEGDDMNWVKMSVTAAALAALTIGAQAQDLPKHHFKVLIQDSPTPQVKLLEAPFWNEWLPAASRGQITADAAPYDQVGIPDDAVLRLLKLGAFDFASFDIAKVAGDDARFEGCDLSGLTLNFEDSHKACDAWRNTVDNRNGMPSCSPLAPLRRRRSGVRPR